jgi:hypothetical protein
VMVAPVDDGHADGRAAQRPRRIKPAEATTDDDDVRRGR